MSDETDAINYNAPEPNPESFVTMFHPVTGGSQDVELKAFTEVWSEKGWVLASDYSNPDLEAPVQVPVSAEQADELGVDHAEITKTETAPSHLAVIGEENPAVVEEAQPKKSPVTKEK